MAPNENKKLQFLYNQLFIDQSEFCLQLTKSICEAIFSVFDELDDLVIMEAGPVVN